MLVLFAARVLVVGAHDFSALKQCHSEAEIRCYLARMGVELLDCQDGALHVLRDHAKLAGEYELLPRLLAHEGFTLW